MVRAFYSTLDYENTKPHALKLQRSKSSTVESTRIVQQQY